MKKKIINFFQEKSNNIILILNVFFSKIFSFILFWVLGIKLIKAEFSEFIIEMPFIFLFSTVLSFGIATFFLDQKKKKKNLEKELSSSLSLVFFLNLLIIVLVLVLYKLEIINFKNLLVLIVTISFNINYILMEFYFTLKKYKKMALVNILPKFLFLIALFFLVKYELLTKKNIYLGLIIFNLSFSIPIFKFLKVNFEKEYFIKYFKFTWVLTIQPFLAYITYVSSRYFIKLSDDLDYLIEFSVLQTYMGVFALLVSISNRLIIHDLYEALIEGDIKKSLQSKILFFNKVFFLFGFLYFHVVFFYLKFKINTIIDESLFISVFIMIIASLVYFVSQYTKTIIVFHKKFNYLLVINVLATILTVLFSLICMLFKINILFPLSIFLVNLFVYIFYLKKVDPIIWNKLFSVSFTYKTGFYFFVFIIIEYFLINKIYLYLSFNVIVLSIIIYNLYPYLFKLKNKE